MAASLLGARLASLPVQNISLSSCRNFSKTLVAACSQNKKSSDDKRIVDFPLYNKAGTKKFKKEQFSKRGPKYPDIPIHKYGVRETVIKHYAGNEKACIKFLISCPPVGKFIKFVGEEYQVVKRGRECPGFWEKYNVKKRRWKQYHFP